MRIVGWSNSGRDVIVKSVDRWEDHSLLPGLMDLLQISLDSLTPSRIGRLESVYVRSTALSPDRKTLAFVKRDSDRDSIQILPVAGGTPKKLIAGNDARVYFSNLVWTHDGKAVTYGKQANWQIISMVNNFK